MTPAQLDRLSRIKRHLETLLANAEKRTTGRWIIGAGRYLVGLDSDTVEIAEFSKDDDWELEQRSNMKFIASCAGNAEAGWKSTLAAIATIKLIVPQPCPQSLLRENDDIQNVYHLMEDILAAWPIEKLP